RGPWPHQLDGNLPVELRVKSSVDHAHSAHAELCDKFVAAGGKLTVEQCSGGVVSPTFCQQLCRQSGRSLRQKIVLRFLRGQQRLNLDAQILLAGARLSDELSTLLGWALEGERHQLVD